MTLALLFSISQPCIMGAMIGIGTFVFLFQGKGRKLPNRFWMIAGSFLALPQTNGLRIGFAPIIDWFLTQDQGNSRLYH